MSFLKTETVSDLFLYFTFCIAGANSHSGCSTGCLRKDGMGASNKTFYFLFIKQNMHLSWENILINICWRGRRAGSNLSSSTNKPLTTPASKLLSPTLRDTFRWGEFVFSSRMHYCKEIISQNCRRETKTII